MQQYPLPQERAERIAYLVACFINNTLSPAERRELDAWLADSDANVRLFEELTDEKNVADTLRWYERFDLDAARRRLHAKIGYEERPSRLRRYWPLLAAACLAALVLSAYFLLRNDEASKPIVAKPARASEIPPAGNKAVLTLADGRRVVLDSAKGVVGNAAGWEVRNGEGWLSYSAGERGTAAPPVYHTLRVPRGGQYRLLLPDGTAVWLNAASELTYPVVFTGAERSVELKGEGYFEVAKRPGQPFIVHSGATQVKVLGTHFNLRAYQPDTVTTTLAEGRVLVKNEQDSVAIAAGSQVVSGGGRLLAARADVEGALAWTKGEFYFSNASIESVLQELARWYAVDVAYEGKIDYHFNAVLPRNISLAKLMLLLEKTGRVHFRLQGRQLTVSP